MTEDLITRVARMAKEKEHLVLFLLLGQEGVCDKEKILQQGISPDSYDAIISRYSDEGILTLDGETLCLTPQAYELYQILLKTTGKNMDQ